MKLGKGKSKKCKKHKRKSTGHEAIEGHEQNPKVSGDATAKIAHTIPSAKIIIKTNTAESAIPTMATLMVYNASPNGDV